MNRVLILAVLLAAASLPAVAQFRGMARSGVAVMPRGPVVARTAPVAPMAGGVGVARGFVPSSVVTRTGGGRIIITNSPFFNPFFPFSGNKFFFNPFFRNRFFFNPFFRNRFFFNSGFNPFFGNGFFNPFGTPFFGTPFLGGGAIVPFPVVTDEGAAAEDQQAALAQQQRLLSELEEDLHQEHLRRLQAEINAAQQPPAPARAAATEAPLPPTVLVFRDGSRTQVENYAIVGNTLYAFAPHATKKIALSALDVPATRQVNEERGVVFHLPAHKDQVVTRP